MNPALRRTLRNLTYTITLTAILLTEQIAYSPAQTVQAADTTTVTIQDTPSLVTCTHKAILYDTARPGYRVDDDIFNGHRQHYCLRVTSAHSFTILTNVRGRHAKVVAYPKVYIGQNYTSSDPQSGLPERASQTGNLTFHLSCKGHARGRWQCDLDLWFSRTRATADQHGAYEMVIVVRQSGDGAHPRTVRLDRQWWDYGPWRTGQTPSWPLIFYARSSGIGQHSIAVLAAPLIRHAMATGWLPRTAWLDSAAGGVECWSGGRGLRVSMTVTGLPPVVNGPGTS